MLNFNNPGGVQQPYTQGYGHRDPYIQDRHPGMLNGPVSQYDCNDYQSSVRPGLFNRNRGISTTNWGSSMGMRRPGLFGGRGQVGGYGGYGGSYGSYGRRGGGIGRTLGMVAVGAGALAIGAGALIGRSALKAGRGAATMAVDYKDKYGHEKEFRKLRHFNALITGRYDGSDVEFGKFMTEHGLANLEPYSAVEFTIHTKYVDSKVCIYLPDDIEHTGLGENYQGEAIFTAEDWFDMLGVPADHQTFYSKTSPLEFFVSDMVAYFVPPHQNMVKPVNPNCVALLIRTDKACVIFREMFLDTTVKTPECLHGITESITKNSVIMISDIDKFFQEPAVKKHWPKLNERDPSGARCVKKVKELLRGYDAFPDNEGDGITCTNNYMFGRPSQALPSKAQSMVKSLRSAYVGAKVQRAAATKEVESKLGRRIDTRKPAQKEPPKEEQEVKSTVKPLDIETVKEDPPKQVDLPVEEEEDRVILGEETEEEAQDLIKQLNLQSSSTPKQSKADPEPRKVAPSRPTPTPKAKSGTSSRRLSF